MFAASHQETTTSLMSFLNQKSLFNLLDDSKQHAPIKDKNKLTNKMKENSKSISSNKTILASSSNVGIADYSEFDVLSGRGSYINTHAGNGYFRSVINEHRRTYLNSKWQTRREIAKYIVSSIRSRGGRFLKQVNEENGKFSLWYEIGDKAAIDKTTQALRQMKMRHKLMVEDEKNRKRQTFKDSTTMFKPTQLSVINQSFGQNVLPNVHQQPRPFSMTDTTNLWLSQQLQLVGGVTPTPGMLNTYQFDGVMQEHNDVIMNRSARFSFTPSDVILNSHPWNGEYGSECFDERLTPYSCYHGA